MTNKQIELYILAEGPIASGKSSIINHIINNPHPNYTIINIEHPESIDPNCQRCIITFEAKLKYDLESDDV